LIVEKWWQFRRVRRQTLAFVKVFREGRRPSIVHGAARKYRESPLAQIYAAAYQEVAGIPEVVDPVIDDGDEGLSRERLEAVDRAMRRAAALEVSQLERYLPFLATTASATPFIGLFGTVWGVMSAFHGIGAQGSANLAVVAPGISEALVATAAGLGAAIPAVIGYNYFVNRVKHWATEMEGFALDLLNLMGRPVPKLARQGKDGV
ncbi:MAG TPA: MotA/TolQ/ExbB proton channel family protein, partial [Methylomirabilota bacterium]|nr:MotA/TolQ/ExbB proton channel family protein [Methylomirabilota bacterium]